MYVSNNDEEPEWVATERQQFFEFRDKNHDGKMDKEETLDWILPSDYDHAEAEAKHLLHESDADQVCLHFAAVCHIHLFTCSADYLFNTCIFCPAQDGRLTKKEILDKYDVFVGSQVTDFGEALLRHDEF